MDLSPLLAALPVEQRLALSYAPGAARVPALAVLALDARLAAVVRAGREPLLAQIRLAWWRELLARPASQWPEGEPVLTVLRETGVDAVRLGELVISWERFLGQEQLDSAAIEGLAQSRAGVFMALAETCGAGSSASEAERAGRNWALVDIALRLSDPAERVLAHDLIARQDWRRPVLPRALRPLAVLHGLARRVRGRAGVGLVSGPGALLAALRLGTLGF